LAELIVHDGQPRSVRKALGPATLFGGSPQPDPPGLPALKALGDIATTERKKPGRKLLVWIGPRREENGTPFEQHEYLNETILKLPNFFATRTTVRYEEAPSSDDGGSRIEYKPLHRVESSKATVLYRRGHEEVNSAAAERTQAKPVEPDRTTYGTFGPILGAANDAVASSDLSWKRWEQGEVGLRAVFTYVIPQEKSHFRIGYCCLPEGDGTTSFQMVPGYHGEITIDPATGAVLRLTMEADLSQGLPLVRSGILVSYGPVEIGGKTHLCPVRSLAVWRSRTVSVLINSAHRLG
jgi:hypothetical protein